MNAGLIIHPPLIVMNADPIKYLDQFDIHKAGTQPAIRRVTNHFDEERLAAREAGCGASHFSLRDHPATEGPLDVW
jgi:opine dehydrogenase